MIGVFDRLLVMTVMADRTPTRFVATSSFMTAAIDQLFTFDRERCHGHRANLQTVYLAHHPTPLAPVEDGRFAHEITAESVRAMRAEAKRLGLSHYRGIPIVVDDGQTGVGLESRPWGEP